MLDLIICKSNNSKTTGNQLIFPFLIIILLKLMDTAIHFNNQGVLMTIKISHISIDNLLSAKMQPIQFIRSHFLPKNAFGRCHIPTHLLRPFMHLIRNRLTSYNILYWHSLSSPLS